MKIAIYIREEDIDNVFEYFEKGGDHSIKYSHHKDVTEKNNFLFQVILSPDEYAAFVDDYVPDKK